MIFNLLFSDFNYVYVNKVLNIIFISNKNIKNSYYLYRQSLSNLKIFFNDFNNMYFSTVYQSILVNFLYAYKKYLVIPNVFFFFNIYNVENQLKNYGKRRIFYKKRVVKFIRGRISASKKKITKYLITKRRDLKKVEIPRDKFTFCNYAYDIRKQFIFNFDVYKKQNQLHAIYTIVNRNKIFYNFFSDIYFIFKYYFLNIVLNNVFLYLKSYIKLGSVKYTKYLKVDFDRSIGHNVRISKLDFNRFFFVKPDINEQLLIFKYNDVNSMLVNFLDPIYDEIPLFNYFSRRSLRKFLTRYKHTSHRRRFRYIR